MIYYPSYAGGGMKELFRKVSFVATTLKKLIAMQGTCLVGDSWGWGF
jgi:hypothetical protein